MRAQANFNTKIKTNKASSDACTSTDDLIVKKYVDLFLY